MKGCSFVTNVHDFTFSPSLICSNSLIPFQSNVFPSNVTLKPLRAKVCISHKQKGKSEFVVGCASWGLVNEFKRELEEGETNDEKGKSGITRYREKCGEREGVVELLECLEKEAIMGDDEGKEPNDYNRRAQIFDKSSQVFQALKESNDHV
ncbi:hypothetical protein MtrunA17_Chr5g0428371 [Medicago truncatula]|uniref:Uncharacterized protein n=1 Tax=Medicago truncatula TaxID=3880 RepID=G7KD75_MEDTR|nr:uncharacterized protein LOC11429408 [Medicago truncatula]AES98377.1 hypothetical protein MTR_5g067740 [Medicago truncatula]RHN56337.1 hypothetical protein MtrunA17_Chr5g0428371 [Medicago truncatula]